MAEVGEIKGIVIGCTISVVLFIIRMNLIIKAGRRETRSPRTASGVYLPSRRKFIDGMTLTTSIPAQARWMLIALAKTVTCMDKNKIYGQEVQEHVKQFCWFQVPQHGHNGLICIG